MSENHPAVRAARRKYLTLNRRAYEGKCSWCFSDDALREYVKLLNQP